MNSFLTPVLVVYAGLVGLVIGSFLNVVIYRVPNGMSVIRPPSACPRCGHRIAWYENIPVVSWLALRARCSACKSPISARYPAVEALTGALFALTTWWFSDDPWAIPAWLLLASVAVALSGIDLDTMRLPDPLVFTGLLAGAPLLVAASLLGETGPSALLRAGIGAAACFAFHFAAMLAYPKGMGFGDVKLAAVTGMYLAWLGWGPLVIGVFSSYVIGLLFAIPTMRKSRKTRQFPFGPSMLLGVLVGAAVGQPLWEGYLSLVGLA